MRFYFFSQKKIFRQHFSVFIKKNEEHCYEEIFPLRNIVLNGRSRNTLVRRRLSFGRLLCGLKSFIGNSSASKLFSALSIRLSRDKPVIMADKPAFTNSL
jgi:hypothetical protein